MPGQYSVSVRLGLHERSSEREPARTFVMQHSISDSMADQSMNIFCVAQICMAKQTVNVQGERKSKRCKHTVASVKIVATVTTVTTIMYGTYDVLHCVLVSSDGVITVKSGKNNYFCDNSY